MATSRAPSDEHFLLLDTPFGTCGIAWNDRGLVRLQLPDAAPAVTQARVAKGGRNRWLGPLPEAIERTAASLGRYFSGAAEDFSTIDVDLDAVPDFHREVYGALRSVPWGETTTYGELARWIGDAGAARAIGQAMGRNPVPIIIPCHRVLASGGALGGFSAPGGRTTKQRLLELERAASVEKLPLFAPR